MLCGHFIGIDKLERFKLLKSDPLVREFDISVREPETVSYFFEKSTPRQHKCLVKLTLKCSKNYF